MMETDRQTLVTGSELGMGQAMAVLLAAGFSGSQVIVLEDEHRHPADRILDRLDVLSLLAPDDRPRDRMGFRHSHPAEPSARSKVIGAMFNGLSGNVTHIDTPKPVSKRRARRLRGRASDPLLQHNGVK